MMNEPIISPWLIYFVNVLDNLLGFFVVAMIGCGLALFFFMARSVEACSRSEEAICKKYAWRLFVALCGLVFLALLTPSSETCWKMLVASKITPAMIQTTGKTVLDTTNQAMDLITKNAIEIIKESKK